MIDIGRKKVITFDFGDTLASTVPTYPDRIRLAMIQLGFDFTEKEFMDVYYLADYQIFKHYISKGSINANDANGLLFSTLKSRLKIKIPQSSLEELTRVQMGQIGYGRELTEFAGDILDTLRSKGFALAVISNNDGDTFEKCRELGISEYFEDIVDSTNVGMIKPDKDIYRYTLKRLKVEADEVVHVGDLYGADILGGINSDLEVIWVNSRKCENYDKIQIRQFSGFKEILEGF